MNSEEHQEEGKRLAAKYTLEELQSLLRNCSASEDRDRNISLTRAIGINWSPEQSGKSRYESELTAKKKKQGN